MLEVYNNNNFLSFTSLDQDSRLALKSEVFDVPRDVGTIWEALEEGDVLVCADGLIEVYFDGGDIELKEIRK